MKALVTGSAGFVGRHMKEELRSRGYWPVVTSDIDMTNRRFRAYHNGDVLKLFRKCDEVFDLVVHCAFHVGGRAAIDGTNTHFLKNLQLDAALFDWAIRTKQKHVLYFSSSAAYPTVYQGKPDSLGYKPERLEEWMIESLNGGYEISMPDANYGWAKLTGERIAEDARKNGLAVSVVRPFSGYGEDQSLDYPFPSIIKRAREGDLTVWGPPGQTRDWIHIDDVVAGALAVVESGTMNPVNLCTGIGTEMGELMKQAYWGANPDSSYKEPEITYLRDKPTGVHYRVGDPARMLKYYTPKVTLEEGIHRALSA